MVRRIEWRARAILSDWPFWTIVAYFGLVALVVALYLVNSRTSRANASVARETAIRVADRQAKASQCLASLPQLAKINRFVRGVQQFHLIIAANNRAILKATPRTDPQYRVRLRNYQRVVKTVADVSGFSFHVPTKAECRARAADK